MAKPKDIGLRSTALRFVAISGWMLSFYNPSGLHALALLRHDAVGAWPKLLVLTTYAAVLLILVRLAQCGLDPFGRFVPLVAALGFGVLLWRYSGPAWTSVGAASTFVLLLVGAVLTLGQVSAYYVRQASGQKPVLKTPP